MTAQLNFFFSRLKCVHDIVLLEPVKTWNKILKTNTVQVQAGVLMENAALQWVTTTAVKLWNKSASTPGTFQIITRPWILSAWRVYQNCLNISITPYRNRSAKCACTTRLNKRNSWCYPKPIYFIPHPSRFLHRECLFQKYLLPLTTVPQKYTTTAMKNLSSILDDRPERGKWW